ncbi:MAG: hypothetical protein WCG04_03135 [Alphaproteobacteria bacterium]
MGIAYASPAIAGAASVALIASGANSISDEYINDLKKSHETAFNEFWTTASRRTNTLGLLRITPEQVRKVTGGIKITQEIVTIPLSPEEIDKNNQILEDGFDPSDTDDDDNEVVLVSKEDNGATMTRYLSQQFTAAAKASAQAAVAVAKSSASTFSWFVNKLTSPLASAVTTKSDKKSQRILSRLNN